MARRSRRKKKNNSALTYVLIAALVIIGLVYLINKIGFGDDSSCGERGVDPDRPGYCMTTSDDFDEIVLVVGNTRNTPAPNLDFVKNNDLKKILSGVFFSTETGGTPRINIVSVAHGNGAIDFNRKNKPGKNISASNNKLKSLSQELNKAINTSPTDGGADYLGGILYARDLISSESENPLILVVGSGYSDSGVLDFANTNLLESTTSNEDEDSVKTVMSQSKAVREGVLSGVTVYWYNMGEVARPQGNMDAHKKTLGDIYRSALDYLGVKKQDLKRNISIPGDAKSVESGYTVQQVYADELKAGDVFHVNERIGKFEADRSVLRNPDQVRTALSQFASRFNPNSGTRLKLTGYIAIDSPGSTLGYERAGVIKDILVGLGIPENKIDVHGVDGPPADSNLSDEEKRTVIIEVVSE